MKNFLLLILISTIFVYADPPWSQDVRVSVEASWDTLNQGESCFAVWGDSIFVICNTAERADVPIAPYAYSFDSGASFQQIPFTDSLVGITWHTDPVIGVDDSGHVHMLIQFSLDQLNHYFSRDGGQTWVDTTVITTDYGVDKPWMVVNNNEIYITWEQVSGQIGIKSAKSTDYGQTFTVDHIWDRTGITALCMDESENLHLALMAFTEGAVWYRKSTDKGVTWSAEQYLSDNYYQSSYGDRFPIISIAARSNFVFIPWVDTRNGSWDIWGILSLDGGSSWEPRFVVNDSIAGGQCKCWTIFDVYGGLHVSYYHTPDWPTYPASPFSFRYQYSPDGGMTFRPSMRVSDTAAPSMADFMGEYHIIQSDSDYVYAIWTDGRNGDDNDLYFSKALISDLTSIEQTTASTLIKPLVSMPSIWHGSVCLEIANHSAPIRIKIYDCLGRFVKNLFSGVVIQPMKIHLKSSEFPTGVFFVHVISDNTTTVKKVVNLK